jgi:hypothetical protein
MTVNKYWIIGGIVGLLAYFDTRSLYMGVAIGATTTFLAAMIRMVVWK